MRVLPAQGGAATTAQPPATMDLWLEEPTARIAGSGELQHQPLTKQSLLLLLKFYDPAAQSLRVRAPPAPPPPPRPAPVLGCTVLNG